MLLSRLSVVVAGLLVLSSLQGNIASHSCTQHHGQCTAIRCVGFCTNSTPVSNQRYFVCDGRTRVTATQQPIGAVMATLHDVLHHAMAQCIGEHVQVTRDKLMDQYHDQWPEYNFAQHKGYGTRAHMAALKQLGPCPIHRRSFAPLKHWIEAGTLVLGDITNTSGI